MLMNPIFFLWIFISATLSYPFIKMSHSNHPSKKTMLNSKPKHCANCQHFIANQNNDLSYGRCRLYPKDDNYLHEMAYVVSGTKKNVAEEYNFCTIIRMDEKLCGMAGKMHKRKYIKKAKNLPDAVVGGSGSQFNSSTNSTLPHVGNASQSNPNELNFSSMRQFSLLKSIL